jgi:hypothetical protein
MTWPIKLHWLIASLPCALLASSLFAQEPTLARPLAEDRETAWSAYIAQEFGGEAEHQLPDGSRIDVLVPRGVDWPNGDVNFDTAWEVEWPEKWQQAIGQAVYYRASIGGRGGVVLLMGRKPRKQEILFYSRCMVACQSCGLRLVVVNVDRDEDGKKRTAGAEP